MGFKELRDVITHKTSSFPFPQVCAFFNMQCPRSGKSSKATNSTELFKL